MKTSEKNIDGERPEISIVTCLYKSEEFLEVFLNEALKAIELCKFNSRELIFVIDGITDNSLSWLLKKQQLHSEIRIVELSRNFGHHYAASAGLNESNGELVFLIDCDLEISPLILKTFYEEMLLSNVEVIYGVQKTRKGKWIEKYMGALFWKIFNVLSNVKVPQNLVTERLMKREYVNSLNSLGDRNLFMAGMMYWVGYSQKAIYVDKKLRKGKSTYSIFKRFSLLIQAITSFSERPLIFIFQLGLLITLISLITSAYFIVNKILNAEQVSLGYSSIIASIFLSLGILVCTIGIIGLYLSRVYRQVQNRPNFIIRKVYSK